jgi:nitrous oxide reductase accessory protein NosL
MAGLSSPIHAGRQSGRRRGGGVPESPRPFPDERERREREREEGGKLVDFSRLSIVNLELDLFQNFKN